MRYVGRFLNITLHHLMAFSILLMGCLVFTNVILRYFFSSGIPWAEELSRFLFIWMIFLGAIGALKDNQHLGVDLLIKRLSIPLKKVTYLLSQLIMLSIMVVLFIGSWKLTIINATSKAPATGFSLSILYGTGVVVAVGMGTIILINIGKLLFFKLPIEQLTKVNQSEELIQVENSFANRKED